MSRKTMVDILNEHWQGSDICGPDFMCFCGVDVGSTDHIWHAEHIAAELAAAGFGDIAQSLDAAADDYRHYKTPNARLYLRARAADIRGDK